VLRILDGNNEFNEIWFQPNPHYDEVLDLSICPEYFISTGFDSTLNHHVFKVWRMTDKALLATSPLYNHKIEHLSMHSSMFTYAQGSQIFVWSIAK
jgi:hypothetical protein